jgi:hypothetical protein
MIPSYDLDLEKSLLDIGQIYDIISAADGEILDGFHRERILKQKGIKPKIRVLEWCKTKEDKLKVRWILNMSRRILPATEKRQYINERAEQLEREGVEPLDIHKRLIEEGFSKPTVYRYLQSRFKPQSFTIEESRGETPNHCNNSNGLRPRDDYNWLDKILWIRVRKEVKNESHLYALLDAVKDHFLTVKNNLALKNASVEELSDVLMKKLEDSKIRLDDEMVARLKAILPEE